MIKTLITPAEISTLARPCYADEEKALAYIVEAEQNNIKPAIGDDLFIQLKEGGQTFLLEGGIYERNGKRYYLNGIKRALAYFVISRLYESSTTELTRQGVVNRRSEYSDTADNSEIISVSRDTYAIANRYMEEIERYLGTDVKNTSQRVHFDLIGGGGSKTQRTCRPSSSGGYSPAANINVVQTLGNSPKDVISQAGVTREFNNLRDEIKDIEVPTLPTLAKVATSGSYNDLKDKPNIPSPVTESTVSGWGFTKNTGNYNKPSSGIPKSDLESAVQTSLNKADTALQQEQYKGTVTGVKINGSTKNPSNGVVDLGDYYTKTEIDNTIGDINNILESIING